MVILGDGAIGKTTLLSYYSTGKFNDNYVPTVFETITVKTEIGGDLLEIALWDTAGQDDYSRLRPLSYADTDAFLLCFSIDRIDSFKNISSKAKILEGGMIKTYVECSSKTGTNIERAIELAALFATQYKSYKKTLCTNPSGTRTGCKKVGAYLHRNMETENTHYRVAALTQLAKNIVSNVQNGGSKKQGLTSLSSKVTALVNIVQQRQQLNSELQDHLCSLESLITDIQSWSLKQQEKSNFKRLFLGGNVQQKAEAFEGELEFYVKVFSVQAHPILHSPPKDQTSGKPSASIQPSSIQASTSISSSEASNQESLFTVTKSLGISSLQDKFDIASPFQINYTGLNLEGFLNNTVGKLLNMTRLNLASNSLGGTIPDEVGNLCNLLELDLSQNQFAGPIPLSVANLGRLKSLILNGNKLTGAIPNSLGNMPSLLHLNLANNDLTNSIPSEIGKLAKLEILSLHNNKLGGRIPEELGNLQNLTSLQLNNNLLIGSIPPKLGKLKELKILHCHMNLLFGILPKELSNCSKLTSLKVGKNKLQGGIPKEYGSLVNLTELDMQHATLTGRIPKDISKLCNLMELRLNNNKLSGEIPNQLTSLVKLKVLDLGYNSLEGIIPIELTKLPSLQQFKINNNGFHGGIPFEFPAQLQILRLEQNHFTGTIPPSLSKLKSLVALCLDGNTLHGTLPREFGELTNLRILNVSYNKLSGPVPNELCNLPKLERLTLVRTELTDIPQPLQSIVTSAAKHYKKSCVQSRPAGLRNYNTTKLQM
ncbi:hypothetical protein HDV04_001503 [Boothiomyces sp. JEL0838]|nr:hypothetical protein HDV04_001503 [Boothiomyces sp. JEL0838]